MRFILLISVMLTISFQLSLFAQDGASTSETEVVKPGAEDEEKRVSYDQMTAEANGKYSEVKKIEQEIKQMSDEAVKEKDFKWKVCLDDSLATIKGIVASINSSKSRMNDLIKIKKYEPAYSQLVLIRGLSDSAQKSSEEAQTCQRQLAKIDSDTLVKKEQNPEITGSPEGKDTIADAMGVGNTDGFVGTSDGKENLSDIADAAGSDKSGGPVESTETEGAKTETEETNEVENVSTPVVVSPVS